MRKKIIALLVAVLFVFPVTIGNATEMPKTFKAFEEPYFFQYKNEQSLNQGSLITYKGEAFIPIRDAAEFLGLSLNIESGNIYLSNDSTVEQSTLIKEHELPKKHIDVTDTFKMNPTIHTYSGIVIENGIHSQPIFSKNAQIKLYPASTTKIMTALLALEKGNLQDVVKVGPGATKVPADSSKAGVKPGDVLTLQQLLYAMMLPSGNDAAVAIAEHISGSEQKFVQLMNIRAKELGASHTNFTNPHGYHHTNLYTTASDLARIASEVAKHPEFLKIASTPYYTTSYKNNSGGKVTKSWRNTNGMVNQNGAYYVPSIKAGKTGYTSLARHNLVSIAEHDGHQYIVVLLRGEKNKRYVDTKNLLTEAYGKRSQLDSKKTTMTIYPFNHAVYVNNKVIETDHDIFIKSNTTYISTDLIKKISPAISAVTISQTQDPKATINKELVAFEPNTATIQNGRMLVPVRSLFEKVGLQVSWDEKTRTVQAVSESTNITMKINNNDAYVNGTQVQLDVPAVTRNGRTLVPIRFVTESTGHTVDWGLGRTVYLQ